MMIGLALAVALQVTAGGAPPGSGSGAARPTMQQQLQQIGAVLSAHGLSPDGVRKIEGEMTGGQAAMMQALGPRMRASAAQANAAANARPFNGAGFEASIRARGVIDADAVRMRADRQAALFHSLSPHDQQAYAMLMMSAGRPPAGR